MDQDQSSHDEEAITPHRKPSSDSNPNQKQDEEHLFKMKNKRPLRRSTLPKRLERSTRYSLRQERNNIQRTIHLDTDRNLYGVPKNDTNQNYKTSDVSISNYSESEMSSTRKKLSDYVPEVKEEKDISTSAELTPSDSVIGVITSLVGRYSVTEEGDDKALVTESYNDVEQGYLSDSSSLSETMTENIAPNSCDRCGCRFILDAHLQDHIKCHNREKLYICALCNKNSITRPTMETHREAVHGVMSAALLVVYNCIVCDEMYRESSDLGEHYKTTHLVEHN